jgi:hypothetical protein
MKLISHIQEQFELWFDAPANNEADFYTTQKQFVESVKQDTMCHL